MADCRPVETAFLSLGSNMGERLGNLRQAVRRLDRHHAISVTKASSVFLTEPVGGVEQPDFLNIVLQVDTETRPRELHQVCRGIETQLGGREGRISMGPRTIDIDILLFGELRQAGADLTIPHPHMLERAFVLVPLVEIAPDLAIPGNGTASEALTALTEGGDKAAVERYATLEEPDSNE
jgi:2-amino-4-hydroxy-6-hydroxymethyldihydropteridine diphosphokinase